MKHLKFSFLLLCSLLAFVACEKNDDNIITKNTDIHFDIKQDGVQELKNIKLTCTEQTTGKVTEGTIPSSMENYAITLPNGVYNIQAEATAMVAGRESRFNGQENNVAITDGKLSKVSIKLYMQISGGFVIQEVLYTGARTDEANKPYFNTEYVIINNNSNTTLYADSLCFSETDAVNWSKLSESYEKLFPNVVPNWIFMVPGSGKDHPLKPGESIVLALQAQNHHLINSKCPNLLNADFEFGETFERMGMADNPEVPNLEKVYTSSLSISIMSTQGNRSLFIFKLPISSEKLTQNYTMEKLFPNGKKYLRYLIPQEWISDGVMLRNPTDDGRSLPVSIDKSWTYVNAGSWSALTIQRKIEKKVDGRVIYVDNNDSANDFNTDLPSSLLK